MELRSKMMGLLECTNSLPKRSKHPLGTQNLRGLRVRTPDPRGEVRPILNAGCKLRVWVEAKNTTHPPYELMRPHHRITCKCPNDSSATGGLTKLEYPTTSVLGRQCHLQLNVAQTSYKRAMAWQSTKDLKGSVSDPKDPVIGNQDEPVSLCLFGRTGTTQCYNTAYR